MLNFPDVCTSSPQHGEAFCREHCQVMTEKGYRTKLKEFLKDAGLLRARPDHCLYSLYMHGYCSRYFRTMAIHVILVWHFSPSTQLPTCQPSWWYKLTWLFVIIHEEESGSLGLLLFWMYRLVHIPLRGTSQFVTLIIILAMLQKVWLNCFR